MSERSSDRFNEGEESFSGSKPSAAAVLPVELIDGHELDEAGPAIVQRGVSGSYRSSGSSSTSSTTEEWRNSSSEASARRSVVSGGSADRCEIPKNLGDPRRPEGLCIKGHTETPLVQQSQQHIQQQRQEDERRSAEPEKLEELPLLPFSRTRSREAVLLGEDSRSGSHRQSPLPRTSEPYSLRRCSSSGAAPDHVSGSRHTSCLLKETSKRLGGGLRCFSLTPGDPLVEATPSISQATLSSNCRSSSSRNSSSRQTWLPERKFSFTGLTTRSLWSTQMCACIASPILAANRSNSSTSLTPLSDFPVAKGPSAGPPVSTARRASSIRSSNSAGGSSSSSSSGSSSRSSSFSSTWEGERQQLQPQEAPTDEGQAVLAFDDPLVRLQSLRLRLQPQSPLLLLDYCCSRETDALQQQGGDTPCPLGTEQTPEAKEMGPEVSGAASPTHVPASVESCYGFTWGSEVTALVAAYEKKTASQRKKLEQRWEAYFASNPELADQKLLKKLVRKGIPDHLRGRLWARFLGADALVASDPGAFERLQQEELPRDVSGQIELDLPRTFPNNKRFRCQGGIAALRRVLRGFAAARPAVGYCQGLNFLAATLLLFQEQELALASLLQLVVSKNKGTGLQIGRYYSHGMTDLRRDLKVLEQLIRQKSPRVFQVLKKTGVEVEWLAAEWFLCLFCTSCPQPTVLRIWDCLMLEGPKILFRVALGVIFFFESQLAKMQLLEQVMGFLKSKLALLVEHNELMHICFHKLRSFPRRKLERLQLTVAVGLVDPFRNTQQQQEQQEQGQQQQPVSRRHRLLSLRRLSRQQSACEAAVESPAQPQSKWRQRLSRVTIGVRMKGSLPASGQATSFYETSHTPEMSFSASIRGSRNSRIRSAGTPRQPAGVSDAHPPQDQQRQATG